MIYIYGKPNCPYCTKAKMYLDQRGMEYKYFDVSRDDKLLEWLKSTGAKTVPQIYFWDEVTYQHTFHIGGYTDMVDYFEQHHVA